MDERADGAPASQERRFERVKVTARPVFVVGSPRSGTSMMQWALRRHRSLWGGPESDFLAPMVKALRPVWEFGRTREEWHWLSREEVDWEEFLRFVGIGMNALYTERSEGRRWVEQTPEYTLHLPDMQRLFPGAQFVVMVRDGRQVVESLRHFVKPLPFDEAAAKWRRCNEAARQFAAGPGADATLFVSFERVITDTEAELERIFSFLGLRPSPRAVRRITERDPMNSSFADESRSEKLAPRWASWSREERLRFVEVAGEMLVSLGYEEDHSWVDRAVAGD